ncbi:MAG: hydrogenase/urease nickel incorporation protein HypA [Campylobacterales bacterium]|nr:hydrogenase/urease nickel incorporation protein HypA [Campylobacterales bacterium]
MHEYSIVQNLIDLCEQNAEQNGASKVHKVVVGIGKLSSVEPELLKTAFDTFKLDTIAKDAELVIDRIGLSSKCSDCGCEFEPSLDNFLCAKCGSSNTRLISGDELLLLSLEIE